MHLSSILILDPRKIVKIVMNFIKSCQLQSELPIPEICTKFIEVLEEHSIVKGTVIGILSFFSLFLSLMF